MKVIKQKEEDMLLLISTDDFKTHETVVLFNGKEKGVLKLSFWDKVKILLHPLITHYS